MTGMEEYFISDEEVEAYERKTDPVRRSVVWSLAAVAAAFVMIGGTYAFGYVGWFERLTAGGLTASLSGRASEEREQTFPLRSSGREAETSFVRDAGERPAVSSGVCAFGDGGDATDKSEGANRTEGAVAGGAVLLSEVAWMGTEDGAPYEWIEIASTRGTDTEIGGWSVVDKDEQIQFVFPKGARLPAGGFILLARGADRVGSVKADFRYTGNLKNGDEGLRLFNAKCEAVDGVSASPKWPAGDAETKKTMERNVATKGWYTSSQVGGTPRAANSPPPLNVSQGGASGEYSVLQDAVATSSPSALASSTPPAYESAVVAAAPRIVISEVMAGKEDAVNWDFVELHNPGPSAADLTGWSLKKKSSAGNESALVTSSRLEGKTIPAGGYILLAHPAYTGSPAADMVWPKSYTLAYANNAVVLYNADGVKVDEVSWTEIPKGQSYAEVGGVWVVGAPTPKAAP